MSAGARSADGAPGERLRFVYDASLASYSLSDEHPFKPVRLELVRTLLSDLGALRPAHLAAVEPLADDALLGVHERRFVEAVRAASRGDAPPDAYSFGLGTGDNPIFPGMHEAVLAVCAATVTALELVATGAARRAVSFAGGLHHAQRARASGFCVYNDLALAIRRAVDRHGLRVAYVDLDAHHGDGVQWLFYDEPRVMTISLHESGRYLFPGTGHTYETGRGPGRGCAVNVPLEPFTEDASFLEVFDLVVPRALRRFRPDLIVLQAGADMHRNDPLADLALSLTGMAAAYGRVAELSEELTGGRLVATGGGGYDPFRTVPRAWAALWAALDGSALPEDVPVAWRERWRGRSPVELPLHTTDAAERWDAMPRREQIASHNRATAERLIDVLEDIWSASREDAGRAAPAPDEEERA